jgi:hypothetical protein
LAQPALFGALGEGQHHRADRSGDQQRRGELEGEQVVGEQDATEIGDVAAAGGVDRGQSGGGDPGEGPTEHRCQQHCQADPAQRGRDPLTAQHLNHRVDAFLPHQHQHEQKQHHDRAGVDDDLHEPQERRLLDHVQRTQAQHGLRQPQCRMHRIAGEYHSQPTGQRERAQDPERDGLPDADGVNRYGGNWLGQHDTQRVHSSSSPTAPERRSNVGPCT